MEQAIANLSAIAALILLIAVIGLILWRRIRDWNARQQAWRESELNTVIEFEASRRGRLGRRADDLPAIKTPASR